MNAVAAKLAGLWHGVTLRHRDLPEPEPVYGAARPMTGFFATLSPEQQKRALSYRGQENHGGPEFLRKREPAA